MNKYLKSKWTSVEKINGWRHYEVRNVLKNQNKLELFSPCDKKNIIIIDIKDIVDRIKWMPGWREIIS